MPKMGRAIADALAAIAVIVLSPRFIVAVLQVLEHTMTHVHASRWKIPELKLAIGIPWKLLVYPHDLAYVGTSPLFPGAVAPAVAIAQWTAVAVGTALLIPRTSLRRLVTTSLISVFFVGSTLQIIGRLAGIAFLLE